MIIGGENIFGASFGIFGSFLVGLSQIFWFENQDWSGTGQAA
jgi:hypothetical protein